MIYLACIVCPVIAMICGLAVLGAVVKFVIEIQGDIRSHNT
jgi:hypothetical protein